MEVTVKIRDEVFGVVEKVAELEEKSVPELIGEGIRVYLQGALDNNLGDYFAINTDDCTYPILE